MEGEGQVGQDPHTASLFPPAPYPQWGNMGVEVGAIWAPGEVLTISGSSSFAFGVGGLYEGGPSRLWGRR